MPPALGQTNDPKALIPGEPEGVRGTAGSFQVYGNMLHEAGAGLQRIDTTKGWSGQAADAFRNVFHGQPAKWLEAGDCFHHASQALDSYADTLAWAQQQASLAIQQWNDGQTATHAAQQEHAQAVQHAQQQAQAKTAAGMPTTAADIPFVDPGEAKRQAARETLDRARSQLKTAAATAAHTIGQARDQAPPKPGFWGTLGDPLDSAWHGIENVGAHVVNDLASLGNAAVHHPGDVAGMLGGGLLTVASGAGETLGVALDATGVGSVAGVPLNAVSAAGMVTGAGIAGAAMANMVQHASGDDHVEPLKSETAAGRPAAPTPGPARRSAGTTSRQASKRT